MVAVFLTFTFARLIEIKQLGFSLAAAVLIDATLIRIILVPAAMDLMGKWNWWFPSWLDRRLPPWLSAIGYQLSALSRKACSGGSRRL